MSRGYRITYDNNWLRDWLYPNHRIHWSALSCIALALWLAVSLNLSWMDRVAAIIGYAVLVMLTVPVLIIIWILLWGQLSEENKEFLDWYWNGRWR